MWSVDDDGFGLPVGTLDSVLQFFEIDSPFFTLDVSVRDVLWWMQWHVTRNTAWDFNVGDVLVKERFKDDNFFTTLQQTCQDG
ncbi:hypothetical protein WICPIJ_002695 [Wickerhamomyces pijperi]|uniref:Uncharacterized protein n=1 Tax=Wickerhamomyces pijperi TaxID=599730 RepID=A0A9P8Q8P3_WICPI|nr:hypothetical protein WICPIJ_002695 [Wickerhamomyces pijperi]